MAKTYDEPDDPKEVSEKVRGKRGGVSLRYQGLSAHRYGQNTLEWRYATAWQKVNENSRTLSYMLSHDNRGVDLTDRDLLVASTVVQWLGSPVGQAFLKEVQEPNEHEPVR